MQYGGTQNWPQKSQKKQTAWSDLFHIFPPFLALLKGKRNAEVSFASGHEFMGGPLLPSSRKEPCFVVMPYSKEEAENVIKA